MFHFLKLVICLGYQQWLAASVQNGSYPNLLKLVAGVMTLLIFTGASYAQSPDPRVERIRKDTGFYQSDQQHYIDDLAAEIRTVREEAQRSREELDKRLQILENTIKLLATKDTAGAPQRTPTPIATSHTSDSRKLTNKVSVCSQGCEFTDLQKAINESAAGAEIDVAPEVYGGCAVINKPIHLLGQRAADGRRTHLAGGVCMGKAALITAAANIVIEGFEISGVIVEDGNGACIRLDPGSRDLTVREIDCHDSQDGMLGAIDGRLLIEDSTFLGNGYDKENSGRAHGLYLSGDEILIRRSRIISTKNGGHSLKAGPRKLTVEDSIIAALNAHNSRALDAFAGGEITLLRNVIQQGPQSDNSDVIGLALESNRLQPGKHELRMEDNWVIFDNSATRGVLLRGRKLGPLLIQNNSFVGLGGFGLEDIQDVGNRWFTDRKQAGLAVFDGTLKCLPNTPIKP